LEVKETSIRASEVKINVKNYNFTGEVDNEYIISGTRVSRPLGLRPNFGIADAPDLLRKSARTGGVGGFATPKFLLYLPERSDQRICLPHSDANFREVVA
jgi:hypothetical protein